MTTSDPDEAGAADRRAANRRRRWLGVALVCIVGLVLALWSERRTIGAAVIDRTLAKAQATARYRIVDLGLGRQRLVDVAIGDPARPDLTADWIELRTRIGWDGARVTAVSAGGLRVRGAVQGGRLSLGAIDRLLPRSGTGAFRLPAVALDVADARAQVTTTIGVVDLSLTGSGRLDDGFRGRVTATSDRLGDDGCAARRIELRSAVRSDDGALTLAGAVGAERLACRGGLAQQPAADLNVTLDPELTAWRGGVALRAGHTAFASADVSDLRGRVAFTGSTRATSGTLVLTGGSSRIANMRGRSLTAAGRFRIGAEPHFAGQVRAVGVTAPAGTLAAIRHGRDAAAASPLAPIVAAASTALARAAGDFDVTARLAYEGRALSVSQLEAASRSGARAAFLAASPIRIGSGATPMIAGAARIAGGGLPAATVRLVQDERGAPIRGVASVARYRAGGAQLALAPVRFAWSTDGGSAATVATLSGPLPDGHVDGLRVPVTARWSRSAGLSLNPGCTAVALNGLTLASLRLTRATIPVCAEGQSLLQVRSGVVAGAARIPALRLNGTLGGSPLSLSAQTTQIALTGRRARAQRVAATLGAGEGATRLEVADLRGALTGSRISGAFSGAAGRIGKVPLLLSDAAGDWRVEKGALRLTAAGTLADAAASARFKPVRAEAIALRLADGAITATARLASHATKVADVTIAHDLGQGAGEARLAIADLAFTERFQPDALTPVTFGVVADVRGAVTGDARVAWNREGVTSTGTFRTDALDLAAAFGPVRGLAGTIRFTDLLALESAPDQVATVASINPGVPVEDGRIVFTLLPEGRVRIARGKWPFAGGSLELRPTTLAFGGDSERRLTFALDGVDAGRFLQQFDFDNINATGTFDGTLPMVFAADGGRIEGGSLRVRRGGGNIAYLGELTKEDLGTWGNLAFQALRSIDYRDLAITMNGPLAGEMITDVRFSGISQGAGARSNVLVRRLQKLPLVFNIRIQAPFRGLIDSAQSFTDPSRLITRNLPALIRQQEEAPIQPGASEPAP